MANRKRKCPPRIPKRLRELALRHKIGVQMTCTSLGPLYQVLVGNEKFSYARDTVRGAMAAVRWAAKSKGRKG